VISSAQVFEQQAKAAGVTVTIQQITATAWYNRYLQWPFTLSYWYYYYYLPMVAFTTLPNSGFDETRFNNPRYVALYQKALATLDKTKRYDFEHEMMMIDYTEGGYIIPFFYPVIDGYATNVHGLVPSKAGLSLNNFEFKQVWLS
jgi:peptide/nickel transport system substrate-binding protein